MTPANLAQPAFQSEPKRQNRTQSVVQRQHPIHCQLQTLLLPTIGQDSAPSHLPCTVVRFPPESLQHQRKLPV